MLTWELADVLIREVSFIRGFTVVCLCHSVALTSCTHSTCHTSLIPPYTCHTSLTPPYTSHTSPYTCHTSLTPPYTCHTPHHMHKSKQQNFKDSLPRKRKTRCLSLERCPKMYILYIHACSFLAYWDLCKTCPHLRGTCVHISFEAFQCRICILKAVMYRLCHIHI